LIARRLRFVIFLVCGAGIAAAQVGAPIPSGQTVTVDAHGECRQVTNPGSGTRMVFSGTAAEWTSFRNNPSGLTMEACSAGNPVCGDWVAPRMVDSGTTIDHLFNDPSITSRATCKSYCEGLSDVSCCEYMRYTISGGSANHSCISWSDCTVANATLGQEGFVEMLDRAVATCQ